MANIETTQLKLYKITKIIQNFKKNIEIVLRDSMMVVTLHCGLQKNSANTIWENLIVDLW